MTRTILGESSPRTPPPDAYASGASPNARSGFRDSQLFKIGWRLIVTLLLLALLLVFTSIAYPNTASAQSASDPLVLAFYYPWYDQNTWSSGLASDLPAEPYNSSDRGVMGRQIDQAKAAGIDAFVVAWYGPGGGNPTESNLAALLEEAAVRNFRIGILFESNSPFMGGIGDAAFAMQHAMNTHANAPAYLRVDGHPVFFFWQTQRYGLGDWQVVRDRADPGRNAIWIADGTDTSYLSLFDGHHLYSNTWSPPADLTSVNQKFANLVQNARNQTGMPKVWVATAMPGYDDVRVRGGFAQDREGGGYYGRSWAAAIASQPNWVVITSFNEWLEGSQIEPSQQWGDAFLGLTATYSAQFKSGGGISVVFPALQPTEASAGTLDTASQGAANLTAASDAVGFAVNLPEIAPDEPTAYVQTPLLNVREGPGSDFEIRVMARTGDALPIMGKATLDSDGSQWWQVFYDGAPGWIAGEFVETLGPLDEVPSIPTSAEQAAAFAAEAGLRSVPETGNRDPATLWVVTWTPFPMLVPASQ